MGMKNGVGRCVNGEHCIAEEHVEHLECFLIAGAGASGNGDRDKWLGFGVCITGNCCAVGETW